jgi:hypothetical protein
MADFAGITAAKMSGTAMTTFEKVCIAVTIVSFAGLISVTLIWFSMPY